MAKKVILKCNNSEGQDFFFNTKRMLVLFMMLFP